MTSLDCLVIMTTVTLRRGLFIDRRARQSFPFSLNQMNDSYTKVQVARSKPFVETRLRRWGSWAQYRRQEMWRAVL